MRPEDVDEGKLRVTRRGGLLIVAKLAALAALGALTAVALLPAAAGGAHESRALTPPTRIIPTTLPIVQFYTVSVAISGNGSVTSSPSGIDCGSTCSSLFSNGTSVTLTAQPASASYEFSGWSGACSGTGTCTVSSGASVTATFVLRLNVSIPITSIPRITVPSTFSLTLATTGSGTVTSSPSGISCGSTCTASFSTGTSVALQASPASGFAISSWSGGGCSGNSATCTVSTGGTITVTFSASPTATPTTSSTTTTTTTTTTTSIQPVIVATPITAPVVAPTPLYTVTVGVSGTGSVTGTAPGSSSAISCGGRASRCFGTFKPGSTVTLHAAPATGFSFTGWSGGCSGAKPACTIKVSRASTVSAHFASKPNAAIIPLQLNSAAFAVKWNASVGTGKLMLHGKIAKTAQVDVQLDRASGEKLVSERLSLPAGSFSLALKLDPGLKLLPGGFVVAISGKSGNLTVPPQVKTLSLPAPPGGVVGRAFASSSEHGAPSSKLHSPKQAFVTFDFQAQPKAGHNLTISWFEPNGKLLGTASKPSGSTITSSIKSNSALPRGAWRVELRSGGTLVKSVAINVA
jgi:hypothetical protein